MLNTLAKPLPLLPIMFLLGGCAMQTYEARPIVPAQTAAQFQDRSLDSPGLQAYMLRQGYPESRFPIKAWGLPELTLGAFHYHPQLAVARAQWQAAQAAEVTAGQKPNPGISANAEHHSKTDGGISPWTLGFAIEFPLETGGKREARMERAASLAEAARIDIGQTAWQIRSRLRSQLLDHQASQQQAALLSQEVALQGEIVGMLEKRLEAGMVSDIDLNQVRLNQQKAQQALSVEQGRLPHLRAQLADAVGLPAQALEQVPLAPLPPLPAVLPDAPLQRDALLNRLDIRAALARYAASEARLKLEIAKQRPDISLAPGYAFDQNDNRWSLGLSMILALLNRNEGPIAEAETQREMEARRFDELQLRVIGELDQSRARYQAALDEIAKAERLLTAQRERAMQTQRQFDAGYIDRLEQTGSRLETLVAEQGLLAAQLRAQRALGMLEDAMQKPLDNSALPTAPENKDTSE